MTNTKKKTRKVITFDESLRKPCKKVSLEGRVPGKEMGLPSDQYYIPRAFIGKGADDTETLCRPLSGGE